MTVRENLLAELAEKRDEKSKLIRRCELEGHLWEQLRRCYGYNSESPGIKDDDGRVDWAMSGGQDMLKTMEK